jgi:hypothetical protein
MLKRINDYLIYCSNPAFIVVACILGVILNIILSIIPYNFLNVNLADQNDILVNAPFGAKLMIGIFVGPFFETLLFQFPPVLIIKISFLHQN